MLKFVEDVSQRNMTTLLYDMRFWSLTLLRAFLGIVFAYHGLLRLFVPGNLAGSAAYFAELGIPLAQASAFLFGVVEFGGGLLLLAGIFTRWSAFILMLGMAVAFFAFHIKNGLLVGNNGYEFVVLLIGTLLVIVLNGAGHLSLGKQFKSKHFE